MKPTHILLIGILLLASFLRFYKLDTIPHGLYIDEVSIGYNAYTMLTKGVDEYGVPYPLFFKAFGEYKMPVAIYMTTASMAVFGKTELAVRFPSALFGTLTVLLVFFLIRVLFKDNRVALVSAFLLAISPWHIQFSRGGFEANIALFLYLLGVLLFLQFRNNLRISNLLLSGLSFVLTIYTYNAYKVITTLTLFTGCIFLYKQFPLLRKKFGGVLLVIILLLLPVLLFSGGNNRFFETSAFSEYGKLPFIQKLILYPMLYLKNYLSFFAFPFLFVTNDGFGRHTIVGMGPLFRFELPFLLIGFLALWKQRKEFFAKTVGFLLFVAPMAAALTLPSPHALRSLLLVIPLTIITAYGLVVLLKKKSKVLKIVLVSISIFALYECAFYLHLYYVHYPARTALDWGSENKAVILEAKELHKQYKYIYISSNIGMLDEYIKFYDRTLPYGLAGNTWAKPPFLQNEKVLFICSGDKGSCPYIHTIPHRLIKNIYFLNQNRDIYVQFWQI